MKSAWKMGAPLVAVALVLLVGEPVADAGEFPGWLDPIVYSGSQSCINEASGQIHCTCSSWQDLDVLGMTAYDSGAAGESITMYSNTVLGAQEPEIDVKVFDAYSNSYSSSGWQGGSICTTGGGCNGVATQANVSFPAEQGQWWYASVGMNESSVINSFATSLEL